MILTRHTIIPDFVDAQSSRLRDIQAGLLGQRNELCRHQQAAFWISVVFVVDVLFYGSVCPCSPDMEQAVYTIPNG